MTNIIKIPKLSVRADILPSSLQEKDGNYTFEVSFASETPVMKYSWDGNYMEVLEMSGMRKERLDNGLSFLDQHDRWTSISDGGVLGRTISWRIDGSMVYATVKMSKREELKGVVQDIQDGILKDISVGYRVYKYMEAPKSVNDTMNTYRATDWEPTEISIVSIPADITAKIRSEKPEESYFNVVIDRQEQSSRSDSDSQKPQKNTMGENPENKPTEGAPVVDAAVRAQIAKDERERVRQITDIGAKMGLQSRALELIDAGTSLDKAREILTNEWVSADPTKEIAKAPNIRSGADEKDKRRSAAVDGLMLRTRPNFVDKPSAGASDFRGMSLLRMAEEVLTLEGHSTRGMSGREIAETALNIGQRSYHSTSDFPNILGDAVNRTLRRAYELQPRTFMPFCRRGSATDFREMNRTQMSGVVGAFDEVIEGAEYKYGSAKDAVEKYKVAKYGKIIAITWESLINDDLQAFTILPTAIAAKAAQKQSDIVYSILLGNPDMGDGVALFHADHGNLGSASAINETGLSAARKAMRDQKSLEDDFINVMPAYMIVGNAKETEAQKLLQATIVATKTADTNIFRGYTDLIVEPRITGTKWFLAANPNSIDTIEYSFLEGESELFTEQRTGFEVDGLEIKARMIFGAKAIDWRGLYYNPGA